MKYLPISLICFTMAFANISCKRENTTSTKESSAGGNQLSALSNLGATDFSSFVLARQDVNWPQDYPQFILFKSSGLLNSYCSVSPTQKTDFTKNDLLLIVGKKIDYGVDFIVDSLIDTSTPKKIYFRTVKNNAVKSPHRPHLTLSIPKSASEPLPSIYLDKSLVGGMTFSN
jgi:hypothetical protein